ncbi:MAG: hypothetical protein QMD01_03790 [Thermodesulfovibrionales bacterium]|nr:hypothetical protein [Thermodesulfovibrionales bacterium]
MSRIKNKNLWINAGLTVISILVTLVILEIILRVAVVDLRPVFSRYPQHYFKADKELGYDINEKYGRKFEFMVEGKSFPVWSNELGCYDEPYRGEKKPILLLGDSFIWGYAPFEHKMGAVIEKTISKRVLKCGVTGFETNGELIKAKRIAKLTKIEPELIIVGYFIKNDLTERWAYPNRTVVDGYLLEQTGIKSNVTGERKHFSREELEEQFRKYRRKRLKQWFSENLALYRAADNAIKNIKTMAADSGISRKFALNSDIKRSKEQERELIPMQSPEKYPWLKEAWDTHLSDIKEFADYAKSIKARLLFVVIPDKEQVYDFLKSKNPDIDYELPNKILKDFFVKNGIEYLDLMPYFKKIADQSPRKYLNSENDLYYRNDGHWNIKGNHMAGLLISKYILENALIAITDKAALSKIDMELQKIKAQRSN